MNFTARAGARDFFALFSVHAEFTIDEAQLERKYYSLMRDYHPDSYAGSSNSEQVAAARLTADINYGYDLLRNEVSRAEYLLELAGVDLKRAVRGGVTSEFLLKQVELREQLESIPNTDPDRLSGLSDQVELQYKKSRESFKQLFKSGEDLEGASRHWLEMSFLEKLRIAISTAAVGDQP